MRVKLPFVPGYDVCVVVETVAPGVTRFRPGDAIFAMVQTRRAGCYAEYVVVPEDLCVRKPQDLSVTEAAAMPLAGLTALQALRDHGKLHAGHRVLVIGASGGGGHYAVQIAKAMGTHVTGVCGPVNVEMVKGLGADQIVDYRETDLGQFYESYDLILDAVAKHSFTGVRHLLTPRGIYVSTLPSFQVLWRMVLMRSRSRARFVMARPRAVANARLSPQNVGQRESGRPASQQCGLPPWRGVRDVGGSESGSRGALDQPILRIASFTFFLSISA